jgi:hypothetical protein
MENNDDDHVHDGRTNVPATAGGGAGASLESLGAMLNQVVTSMVGGRSGKPMAQFKAREGNGTYTHGQRGTAIEAGSQWTANPASFQRGYVLFDENNKFAGGQMVSVSKPMPDRNDLPNHGEGWSEQWTVDMKCLTGSDAGLEVTFKSTTDGGIKAIVALIDAIRDRINSGQHGDKVVPVLSLDKDGYQHPKHGRIWYPVFVIVDWMPLSGPAANPSPSPPPAAAAAAASPRRRRVA